MSADSKKGIVTTANTSSDMNRILHGEGWWRTGAWKEPEKTGVGYQEPKEHASNFISMNPECTHDRCSHTIANCPECIVHSVEYRKNWLAARELLKQLEEKEKMDGNSTASI